MELVGYIVFVLALRSPLSHSQAPNPQIFFGAKKKMESGNESRSPYVTPKLILILILFNLEICMSSACVHVYI